MQASDYVFYPGGDTSVPRCCKICVAWRIAVELDEASNAELPARREREPRAFDKEWLLAQQFPAEIDADIAQRALIGSQMSNSTNITNFKDSHLLGAHKMRDCETRLADGKTRQVVESATRPWRNLLAQPGLAAVFSPKEKAMRDKFAAAFATASAPTRKLSTDELVVLAGVSNYEPFTWVENPFMQEILRAAGSKLVEGTQRAREHATEDTHIQTPQQHTRRHIGSGSSFVFASSATESVTSA